MASKSPSRLELDDYLPYLINRVGSIIAEQFAGEVLTAHGLTIAMWRVLAALAAHGSPNNGSLRQIDLAGFTSIETSTLSRLVSRLVRAGLVTRGRSTNSDREVAVKLSAKGDALAGRLIPLARQYETAAIAGLTREELLVLKRCLRRAYANMKNREADPLTSTPRPIYRTHSQGRR